MNEYKDVTKDNRPVKHASSRVRILLHAIYKRKKATENGGFLRLFGGIVPPTDF